MAIQTSTAARFTSVAVHPATDAGLQYRADRADHARAAGFPPEPRLNLRNFGGRTIEHLTFTNVYLGGTHAWDAADVRNIDWALAAAMSDRHLNNVLAQYWVDGAPTTAFKPSRFLDGLVGPRVYRDTVEGFAAALEQTNALSGFDLTKTVFNFLLPRGAVLVDGDSSGRLRRVRHEHDHDEAVDSRHGLGGFHGSIHARRGAGRETVYYAVGVYCEGGNGIVQFREPWKNVCAVFYHELVEARTDPDVEDAIRAGDTPAADRFLGWYSPRGGEIGDIPLEEAGANLGLVMKEVTLTGSTEKVPVQLMWSNAVSGPEGPIPRKHHSA
jgi:hypothetical protein